jgi:hypothetical protein
VRVPRVLLSRPLLSSARFRNRAQATSDTGQADLATARTPADSDGVTPDSEPQNASLRRPAAAGRLLSASQHQLHANDASCLPRPGISDKQTTYLSGYTFIYALGMVPCGMLADRVERTNLLAVTVLAWCASQHPARHVVAASTRPDPLSSSCSVQSLSPGLSTRSWRHAADVHEAWSVDVPDVGKTEEHTPHSVLHIPLQRAVSLHVVATGIAHLGHQAKVLET